VTNSDNLISGVNLSFNGALAPPGATGLAEVVESVDTNMTYPYGQLTVEVTPTSSVLATNLAINPPQPSLNLDKDVITYSIGLSFASISQIDQSFMQVPEPSTITLAAAGLLTGLVLIRRRRR
jgi:hypothetical protein